MSRHLDETRTDFFATLFTLAANAAPVTTVILVRHAQRASAEKDPPLAAEGEARAQALARVLRNSGLTAIYTTTYLRTKQTAAPTAELLKVAPVAIEPGATFAADMAAKILAEHKGGTVLVVGHSNTTPQVMKALGIETVPKIEESEYDNLFVVTIVEGSEPRMFALRY